MHKISLMLFSFFLITCCCGQTSTREPLTLTRAEASIKKGLGLSDGTASSFFSLERERSRLIDSLYKAGTDKKNGGSLQAVRMKAVNRDFRSKIETLLTREQLRRYDLLLDAQKGKLEREKQAGR